MNRTYLFSYFGNKDKEFNEIFKNLNFDLFDTIVECFGGSFSLIRNLINEKKMTKKFIVNDIDHTLISSYNEFKDEEKNKNNCNELVKIYNDCHEDKNKYKQYVKESVNNINYYVFKNIFYNIRPGLFPINKKIKIDNHIKRIKKFIIYKEVAFISKDAFDLIEEYKDNEKALIFLDPPFLLSCNSYYLKSITDKILIVLKNFKSYKCHILLTMGNHPLYFGLLKLYEIDIYFKTSLKFKGFKSTENIYVYNKFNC